MNAGVLGNADVLGVLTYWEASRFIKKFARIPLARATGRKRAA